MIAVPASAQVPSIQVYNGLGQSALHAGVPGTTEELLVVLRNVDFIVSAVDFQIDYPPSMIWLGDQLPDARYFNNEVITIGSSPTGIAIAWHNCCMQDAVNGLVVLRPLILWGPSGDICSQALVVRGYAPLGKTNPSVVRFGDFSEHTVIGMTSVFDGCATPVQPTTWGSVKALYR
jgi:hypothetical protein